MTKYPLVFLGLFLVAWSQAMTDGDMHQGLASWSASHMLLGLLALAAGCVAFKGIAAGEGFLGQLLSCKSLQFLGVVSYSLYMWQFLTMTIIKHLMLDLGVVPVLGSWCQAVFLIVSLPPTLAVAWASQNWLERRLSGWLRNVRRPAIFVRRVVKPRPVCGELLD
jgi:peptidoglycan/LPS O-acetylase OafA/YrhL